MINIKVYHVTQLATNCSYIIDEKTGVSAVVDPGAKSEKLNAEIEKNGGRLKYILLTHGHYDHICYAKEMAEKFGAKIVSGEKTNPFFSDVKLNLSAKHGIDFKAFSADVLLKDGDVFKLGETEIRYLSTPGHTSGCGVFIADDLMLSGDTLFCESYGRTDLPSSDEFEMIRSLKKLKELDGDYRVIPGHGHFTTLEHERKYNPLMRRL